MPAEIFALPGAAARARDLARRLGVGGFWHWWMRNLGMLVPAGPRAAVQRRRMRPVIAFDGETAGIWVPRAKEGRIDLVEAARVALAGDAANVATEGKNALAPVARLLHAGGSPLKVVVALAPRAMLRKTLTLPAAVENDLRQTLAYDLDRHTPFKPEELYFDAAVVDRDPARNQIRVDLAAARRTLVDAALAHAKSWGATVVAVTPVAPPAPATTTLNLLPVEMRSAAGVPKRWQFWLPIAVLLLIALVAVVLPVWQKREYAIALNAIAAQTVQQAAISETLRLQLDRQVGDYNFALERKYAFPGTVRVIEEVSHLLPDDTWLTQFELKIAARGKEASQREVSLRGESVNAGRLVTLLEDSRLFTQAAPRSPTTKIQPGPGEIFDVGAQLKPLPPPTAVALAPVDKPPQPAPGAPAAMPATVATPAPAANAPAAATAPAATPAAGPAAPAAVPPAAARPAQPALPAAGSAPPMAAPGAVPRESPPMPAVAGEK